MGLNSIFLGRSETAPKRRILEATAGSCEIHSESHASHRPVLHSSCYREVLQLLRALLRTHLCWGPPCCGARLSLGALLLQNGWLNLMWNVLMYCQLYSSGMVEHPGVVADRMFRCRLRRFLFSLPQASTSNFSERVILLERLCRCPSSAISGATTC